MTNVTRSIQDISKAVEESAIAVNNVSNYVSDLPQLIGETYSFSKEVEKEFSTTYETILVGAQ